MNYSYLKASIGESLEALRAGKTPKTTPTRAETPKETATAQRGVWTGRKLLKMRPMPTPKTVPMMPPTRLRMTASIKN